MKSYLPVVWCWCSRGELGLCILPAALLLLSVLEVVSVPQHCSSCVPILQDLTPLKGLVGAEGQWELLSTPGRELRSHWGLGHCVQ